MANTKVKAILGAVITKLGATAAGSVTKPTGLTVTDSRRTWVEATALPQQSVIPIKDTAFETKGRDFSSVHRVLHLAIFNRCIGTDQSNEDLRAWALQQLFSDTTLGGIVLGIREGDTEWTAEVDSENDFSEAPMEFIVEYARPREVL
jgi:hypothetical protein